MIASLLSSSYGVDLFRFWNFLKVSIEAITTKLNNDFSPTFLAMSELVSVWCIEFDKHTHLCDHSVANIRGKTKPKKSNNSVNCHHFCVQLLPYLLSTIVLAISQLSTSNVYRLSSHLIVLFIVNTCAF